VDVGEGPTGVALHETKNRLYVLNRFSNSIALVDAVSFTKLGEVALHDPSSATIRDGRRFLYDAVLTSGHGDGSCASSGISRSSRVPRRALGGSSIRASRCRARTGSCVWSGLLRARKSRWCEPKS
jgi:hypothetical protein